MDPRLFVTLLTPSLSLVLSAAFALLWVVRRDSHYVALLAVAYLAISISFAAQAFELGLGYHWSRLVSNLLFLIAISLLVAAVLQRRHLRQPFRLYVGILILTMSVTFWFTWVQEDFVARVVVVNAGLGAVCIVGVFSLLAVRNQTLLDRMILAVIALGIVNYLARPVAEVMLNTSTVQMPDIMSPYWLTTSLTTIIYGLLVALTMLTAAALDAIRELQAQTLTDPLSGLLNRRGFEQQAAQALDLNAMNGLPVALVMADLDHFKAVNDRHGHAMGDKVIADFARKLGMAMNEHGIAGRLGGEEFAVLLPLTDLAGARLLAEAVRTSLRDIDGVWVTASFGVAEWRRDEKLERLLSRGDIALYQAKRAGRDCVHIFDDGAASPQSTRRYFGLTA